jgi:hypothetical protein
MPQRLGTSLALTLGIAGILLIPILGTVSCCSRRSASTIKPAPAPVTPPIGLIQFSPPMEALNATSTQTEMRNVEFRLDRAVVLHIHELRGEMFDKSRNAPLNFDNKNSFIFKIARGEVGIDGRSLSELMNHYVFGYAGAPLTDLQIAVEGNQLRQEGVMHKGIAIPFSMLASVSMTPEGWIRVHPNKIDICSLDGKALLKAFGLSLEKLLDVRKATGVKIDKNDLLIDPLAILPPPAIEGRITAVRLEGDELIQVWSSDELPPPLMSSPDEPNYMYFRKGTLRMGKLFMVDADMEVVDADPTDPFDFFLDYYNNQLDAGFTDNLANYGLKVFMRDFADLGSPVKAGERAQPNSAPHSAFRG